LVFEEKYTIDEEGSLRKRDPVEAVRNALESSEYKLDGYWYSWGMKRPIKVDIGSIELDP